MAVMRNSIIFGGVDSADFGIYIGGEGTFNAPKRDVEMISIPGRNGAFALDKGRFENIEVKYSAFNYEPDLATFSANLEAFRNAICSQKGYQRLTDTFHSDEYRMAAYIGGLEINPIDYNTAATFTITFDCMPQRYLTSGETTITVADGQTITNPTLFASSPMLEVEGYGNINVNGYAIERKNATLGVIQLVGLQTSVPIDQGYSFTFDKAKMNDGDTIYFSANANWGGLSFAWGTAYTPYGAYPSATNSNADAISRTGAGSFYYASPIEFTVGTSKTITNTQTITAVFPATGTTETATWTGTITYDGDCTFTASYSSVPSEHIIFREPRVWLGTLFGDSTLSTFGTVYIDCDLGEAYTVIDGSPVSANAIISMGADLPTLASGANEISYDSTITSLKITPRWWKV